MEIITQNYEKILENLIIPDFYLDFRLDMENGNKFDYNRFCVSL